MHEGLTTGTGLRASSKAAREDTRAANRRLVLQHLFGGRPLSRADLARVTQLTPATVSALISELEEWGLVAAVGTRRDDTQIGKPPTMLQIRPEARNVIALDLSEPGTLRAAVVDLGGGIVERLEVAAEGATGHAALDLVTNLARRAVGAARSPILGIGVGTPGVVSPDGSVLEALAFGWQHIGLRDHLVAEVGQRTYVSNDANVAAIAEYSRGEHGSANLAAVKIGSGVGAGFILNGQPFRGEHSGAGEIGHLVVDPAGPKCRCGHYGCLETFVTSPNIEEALAQPDSDPDAVRNGAAERLGIALAAIVAILDIDQILVSGPRRLLGDKFCEHATASLRTRCLDSVAESVNVSYTSLGDDVILLGAAGLVLSQELGVA